jgi:hypothetical protein
MKALCLGMPRTGTASMIVEFGIQALVNGESALRMALLQLSLADSYHMVELWEENPKDDDL